MKKLFLGILILSVLLIAGVKYVMQKENERIEKLFEIDESLSGEGKEVDLNLEGY